MAQSDSYFTFPVSVLRIKCHAKEMIESDFHGILHDAKNYSIGYMMGVASESETDVWAIAAEELDNQPNVDDIDDQETAEMLWAARTIGVELPYIEPGFYVEHRHEVDAIPGGATRVRLRSDLFWDALLNSRFTPVEFFTLCAVYAGIGDRPMKKLYRQHLVALSAGYSSQKELSGLGYHDRTLTESQLRYSMDRMEARGFFARIPANRRQTWYSNSMSLTDLVAEVARIEVAVEDKLPTNERKREMVQTAKDNLRRGNTAKT